MPARALLTMIFAARCGLHGKRIAKEVVCDKIVTGLFMSLDGIVEADDSWQFAYFDEELFEIISAGFERADTVLMGRRSLEGYDALRIKHPDSPMVAFLNQSTKYVVSTTRTSIGWHNSIVLGDDPREQIAQLKAGPGKDILVLGSPTLVRWLLRADLLDELNIIVLPIVVGAGVRLFEDMNMPAGHVKLALASTKALTSGALEVKYTPAGQ